MAPAKPSAPPVMVSLRADHANIVQGCCGVQRSVPRIETVLELRPINGVPFAIRSVGIELKTVQKVTVPAKLSSTDTQQEYVVYNNPFAFRPPIGQFSQRVLALDVPILFPLPRDIISSGMFPNSQATTLHYLVARVACGPSHEKESIFSDMFPVSIKCYDTLPIYRQFNEPLTETLVSNGNQVVADISLSSTAVGPDDTFTMNTKISTNPLHSRLSRKARLKLLTLQVKEVLVCHEGGLPPRRETKLFTTSKSFETPEHSGVELGSSGVTTRFDAAFPIKSPFLSLFGTHTHGMKAETRPTKIVTETFLGRIDEGMPITHIYGFTSAGNLFSVRYETVLKVKVAHGKDFEMRIPLTVSPYNRETSEYLLQWIMKQCAKARQKFGPSTVDALVRCPNYGSMIDVLAPYTPPPIVYHYRRQDWIRLGYNGEVFGTKSPKNMLDYID